MVKIGNVVLDNGMPKICVPIVGHSIEELIQECRYLQDKIYDVVELRIDFLQDVTQLEAVGRALQAIRQELPSVALLFTFRTKKEGGETEVPESYYFELLQYAIRSRHVDAVDIEYFRNRSSIKKTLEIARECGVTVIMSNHDFNKTPSFDEITERLTGMKKLGADVAKLACMPISPKDVLTLLRATEAVKSQYPEEPIITMSMGKLGAISRISGEIFGSALTFGSAKKASAPGQLEVTTLQQILRALH
ncbi:3-dehydroquinate dehydratase [Megasphaera cerevisiae DSM 20462]|jgi:3-dehydroquinate dehydratase-1|uniref:3-dehydroquinate dehydratase n=1 Tax=Megasphaera cerevisiae DSM 20462 TaxID=1122219 RepID=A0A0J6WQM4_9FIRM|nr:type I 3-dehydroquinate dehydratase [Megasphaera cerevisiae]KMO85735.1 3-dehydroquinate dehydratase [Megasphaera cerevisiae DSM 20462]SJZ96098.1 3-dehydroquinate dehydratase [Megasphaera cerevisiae DSM 20462]